jgi:hypothetical protein
MLAHNIKEVLTIVPEAMGFIKEASLEQDFPVDSKDSAAASYLTAAYLVKVAGKALDIDLLRKLEKAASLYGVKDEMDKFIPRFSQMTKQASEEHTPGFIKAAEAMFEGNLAGFLNIEKAAEQAEELMKKYAGQITSSEVHRYSGHAFLNKEAAIQSLANRYYATKQTNPHFIKIARLINDSIREDDFLSINDICKTVTILDKQAGLDIIGFNFYKEALLTKEAAIAKGLMVRLNGKDVPHTKIAMFGKDRIGSYLGKDIGDAMTGDPVSDKYMLEALPRDLQIQLTNVLKNV